MTFFNLVCIRCNSDKLEVHSGMDEATSEDLAFPTLFGGGIASLSPFQRSPRYAYGSLPPLLGQDHNSCPATNGTYPLGISKHRFSATMFSLERTRRSRTEDCLRKLRTVDSENTPLLPQRNQYFSLAKAFEWKKPFEGEVGVRPYLDFETEI